MPAAGVGPLTYSIRATLVQHDCCTQHYHPQFSMIDLLSVYHIQVLLKTSLSHSQSLVAPDHAELITPLPLLQRLPLLNWRSPLCTQLAPSVRTLLYKRPSHE